MRRAVYILVCTMLATVGQAAAHRTDSLPKERSRVGRLIHETIFREPSKVTIGDSVRLVETNSRVIDEQQMLHRYDGKTVGSIAFDRRDVYEDKSTWFRALANGMHIRTMESTVRRDLLLSEGDTFDAVTAVAGNQILRGRPYLSESRLVVQLDPTDTTRVNITVVTLDSWTIGVRGGHYRDQRAMGEIYDANFLGAGVRVGLKNYLQYRDWRYGGQIFEFENPNFFGSFYTARFTAGRNFESSRLEVGIAKEFILPSDYELGASFSNIKETYQELYRLDSLDLVKTRPQVSDIWWGRSKQVGRSSIYLTAHYNHTDYVIRPDDTAAGVNPLFHDRDEALLGLGLYRERFYTTSMIYGYGFQEYIAAGSRMELIGGYSRQEFDDYIYGGLDVRRGRFMRGGYYFGHVSVGSYISPRDGSFSRSVVNFDGRWISNMWGRGHNRARQFITLRYTQGWNMGRGAGALVKFTDETRPVGFNQYAAGRTRLLLNTETVLFTPHQPFGFRLAVFGFADAGLIGENDNPLANDFYSTFGVGIRFKNERLIFSALQLRVGFAVGPGGFIRNEMFNGSVEQRIRTDQLRFIPSRPERVRFE